MTQTCVWVEIPVIDLEAATAFYNAVFQWGMEPMMMGPDRVSAFGRDGIGGNLTTDGVPGQGQGSVIYLAVPDRLDAALTRARAAGARQEGDEVGLPKGRYVIVRDPDGNRIGLFEKAAAPEGS